MRASSDPIVDLAPGLLSLSRSRARPSAPLLLHVTPPLECVPSTAGRCRAFCIRRLPARLGHLALATDVLRPTSVPRQWTGQVVRGPCQARHKGAWSSTAVRRLTVCCFLSTLYAPPYPYAGSQQTSVDVPRAARGTVTVRANRCQTHCHVNWTTRGIQDQLAQLASIPPPPSSQLLHYAIGASAAGGAAWGSAPAALKLLGAPPELDASRRSRLVLVLV